jgi:hypothetical protein
MDAWAELLGEACTLLIGYVPDPCVATDTAAAGLCACPECVEWLFRQIEATRAIAPE